MDIIGGERDVLFCLLQQRKEHSILEELKEIQNDQKITFMREQITRERTGEGSNENMIFTLRKTEEPLKSEIIRFECLKTLSTRGAS